MTGSLCGSQGSHKEINKCCTNRVFKSLDIFTLYTDIYFKKSFFYCRTFDKFMFEKFAFLLYSSLLKLMDYVSAF